MRRQRTKESAIVLLSGGIDSAVVAALLTNAGTPCHGLFLNYQQPALEHERTASQKIADYLNLSWSEQTLHPITPSPQQNYPARNLHMITHTLHLCQTIGAALIAIGCGQQDATAYPDTTPEFLDALSTAIMEATQGHQMLYAPLVHSTKLEILALAHIHQIPLSLTRSCNAGTTEPCNTCPACNLRNQAIQQATAMSTLAHTKAPTP